MLAAITVAVPLGAARADELSDAFVEVIKNPTDTGANLRYAKLAEAKGKPRLALVAYERVLLNDPANEEARAGLQHIRRELQPSSTQFRVEVGTSWDSNPQNLSSGGKNEPGIFASIAVRDERSAGSYGWRTTGIFSGDVVKDTSDLNYGYVGAGTGPVIDLTPGLSVYTAVGLGAAQLDQKLYYREANLAATFEGLFGGAYESVRLRAGVRHYGPYFTADKGYFADAIAKFSVPHVLGDNDLVVISPWLRWSGINGAATTLNFDEIQPGRYREIGAGLDYYAIAASDIVLGTGLKARERYYSSALSSGSKRQDSYIAPDVSVTFKDVLMFQSDIKLQYTYRYNRSNEDFGEYHDHALDLSVIYQF